MASPDAPDVATAFRPREPQRQRIPARVRALRKAQREAIRAAAVAGGGSRREIEARALLALAAAGLYRARTAHAPRSTQREPPGGSFEVEAS
jgi:hypothetical protein